MANQERHIGLFGATGVGVGAIVGGGILALAGVAFATTGPSAIIAFALNGVIAVLTALSFAEMASKFPESGGTYTFARKVLSVESAFTVGWVVWFASIVAAVLYALGFASFAIIFATEICMAVGWSTDWAMMSGLPSIIAITTTIFLSLLLIRSSGGGGDWANIAKVSVFGILIIGGLWAVLRQDSTETVQSMQPFFANGLGGLVQAMGYSFIALQGFDLIAAVGGEVKSPAKTIPKAMIISLVIAILIYLPLLFVITTVGTPSDQSVTEVAAGNPEAIVAVAAKNYLGTPGYWLVIIAAVLSMFTALQANLFAASRIGLAMARDRTLPTAMSRVNPKRGTPGVSVMITAILASVLMVALPDVAAAGAASSLIFLITFATAHWLSILVRQRSEDDPPPFKSPLFPAVPVIGGVACLGLAIFQGIAVPTAGLIATAWLGIGGLLFLTLFARSARLRDVSSIAANPELVRLRGSTPLVLVPIANPDNADSMIALADTLVPRGVGRVLLQTIVVAPNDWSPDLDDAPIARSQAVLRELIATSTRLGVKAETLMSVATEPMEEISRAARMHRCESVLLGLSEITEDASGSPIEGLLSRLEMDVVVLRAPKNWQLSERQRILIPVAGRGGHDHLLVRILGSLARRQNCEIRFLRVISSSAPESERRKAKRELQRLAGINYSGVCQCDVVVSDDAIAAVVEASKEAGLMILGVQRIGKRKLFGRFTRQVSGQTQCPLIVISRRS
ncbi:Serine/threonine exchanger SteT [Rubripirellula obstinata]|uniref:Serine/threonine exchanger SteT n=1 Tax=Rubripirellula obstinata TaxID=406547 RepID=A0A5B1CMA6_9BACT|nr:amino acid permease [Rubripirellula obstinata]KAA1261035.1 Serine/threonine exchanger SteT [Rubripirellula obstinata]